MKLFDPAEFRAEFPALHQEVNGHPLVYLDSGATTQKPRSVIDTLDQYYQSYNSNVHRGAHDLADRATRAFEAARQRVADFIHAEAREVIWTGGTTGSINMIAASWGRVHLKCGDQVLISEMEHHSNIVPWQFLARELGIEVVAIPVTPSGELDLDAFNTLLTSKVKLLSVTHISNALGTINPIETLIKRAHDLGARVLIDGAQSFGHRPIDVKALDCDFYAASAHKAFGPTGIGIVYGKYDLLESMEPWQGGGEMIETVSLSGSTFQPPPLRFEAGTPDISGAIGFAAAVDFINQYDRKVLIDHEHSVLAYAHKRAETTPSIQIVGTAAQKSGVLSFLLEGAHPHDVGTLLNQQGVAVRTGHHCCQPLMEALGIPGTVRTSFSIYNTSDDVDALFAAIAKAETLLL